MMMHSEFLDEDATHTAATIAIKELTRQLVATENKLRDTLYAYHGKHSGGDIHPTACGNAMCRNITEFLSMGISEAEVEIGEDDPQVLKIIAEEAAKDHKQELEETFNDPEVIKEIREGKEILARRKAEVVSRIVPAEWVERANDGRT